MSLEYSYKTRESWFFNVKTQLCKTTTVLKYNPNWKKMGRSTFSEPGFFGLVSTLMMTLGSANLMRFFLIAKCFVAQVVIFSLRLRRGCKCMIQVRVFLDLTIQFLITTKVSFGTSYSELLKKGVLIKIQCFSVAKEWRTLSEGSQVIIQFYLTSWCWSILIATSTGLFLLRRLWTKSVKENRMYSETTHLWSLIWEAIHKSKENLSMLCQISLIRVFFKCV